MDIVKIENIVEGKIIEVRGQKVIVDSLCRTIIWLGDQEN